MPCPELIIVHTFFSINLLSREAEREKGGGRVGGGERRVRGKQKIQSCWSEVLEHWSISLILM